MSTRLYISLLLGCTLNLSIVQAYVDGGALPVISSFNNGGGYQCLRQALGQANEKMILPEDGNAYDVASQAVGSKWKKFPFAIVYPSNTSEISKVAACGFKHGIPMTVAAGRHSFQGASIQSGYLVIDISKSCEPPLVDPEKLTLTMSGGCLHADVIGALYAHPIPGAMALIGAMPLVGYGGWSTGGGYGNLAPYVGIGCDQFEEIEMILYNGSVVRANRDHDLMWASCGGGTGFGILSKMTLKLTISPDPSHFTRMMISYPVKTLPHVLFRLQNALMSEKLVKFGAHGPSMTPDLDQDSMVQFFFLYLGPWREAVSTMKHHGLLDKDLYPWPAKRLFGAPPQVLIVNHSPRFSWGALPSHANIIVTEYSSYPYAMAPMLQIDDSAMNNSRICQEIECAGTLASPMSKKAHDILLRMTTNRSSLLYNEQESTRLHDSSNLYRHFQQPGHVINWIPLEAWEEIVNIPKAFSGYNCGWTIPHLAGGKTNAVPSHHTAYPWRNASFILVITGEHQQFCWEQVSKIIGPYQPIQGYYNYLGHQITRDFQSLYFGENALRIAKLRRLYDPLNMFGKPLTVDPMVL